VRKHWLVLSHSDFLSPLGLSQATDLLTCEAEADSDATDCIKQGEDWAYVYELKRVYLPHPKEPTKDVEVVYVD